MNSSLYEIIMSDPLHGEFRVVLPRAELSRMVSRSISLGVMASCEIEGEDMRGVIPIEVDDLPEIILVTPKIDLS